MVPAPRVFQFSCRRLSTLFRARAVLLPRSMRSTAGCSWSYLVAQPGLVTANQSLLSCSTVSLSSLLATKPWYESEEEGLAEIELTDNGSLLSWGTSCQWGVFHLIMRYDRRLQLV